MADREMLDLDTADLEPADSRLPGRADLGFRPLGCPALDWILVDSKMVESVR